MPDPTPPIPQAVSMSWLGIPMPLWNLISTTLIAIVLGFFGYQAQVSMDKNRAAIEASKAAIDANKAAVEEGTAVAEKHNIVVGKKLDGLTEEVKAAGAETAAKAAATMAVPGAEAKVAEPKPDDPPGI